MEMSAAHPQACHITNCHPAPTASQLLDMLPFKPPCICAPGALVAALLQTWGTPQI